MCRSLQEVRGTSNTSASPVQGSSVRKRSPQKVWLWKPVEIVVRKRVTRVPGIRLQGSLNKLPCWWTDLLWAPALGQQVRGHWGIWEGTELSGFRPRAGGFGRSHCFFVSTTQPVHVGSAISESPTTWLMLFTPPWWLPKTPSHPIWRPIQVSLSDFAIQMPCLGSCWELP